MDGLLQVAETLDRSPQTLTLLHFNVLGIGHQIGLLGFKYTRGLQKPKLGGGSRLRYSQDALGWSGVLLLSTSDHIVPLK